MADYTAACYHFRTFIDVVDMLHCQLWLLPLTCTAKKVLPRLRLLRGQPDLQPPKRTDAMWVQFLDHVVSHV
jgi:hypothetical protein